MAQPNYRVIDGKVVDLNQQALAPVASSPLRAWIRLLRIDKPIGYFLLLWPTLAALCLAAGGFPRADLIWIFTAGVVLTRSAGCVINDYADRWLDGSVQRTANRPLATGEISGAQALIAFAVLMLVSLALVLMLPRACLYWAIAAVLITVLYPYCKRYTHYPQFVLGLAFSVSIPMAFAAHELSPTPAMALLLLGNLAWTVGYDTLYAMVDREDDLAMGAKSTAILFGEIDLIAVGIAFAITSFAWALMAKRAELGALFWWGWLISSAILAYSIWHARSRSRDACFAAFKLNHFAGLALVLGVLAGYQ
jgi:4-hydroxybenzoate polyprenyltransferase